MRWRAFHASPISRAANQSYLCTIVNMMDARTLTAVISATAFRSKKLWRLTMISSPERSGAHADAAFSQSVTFVRCPFRMIET